MASAVAIGLAAMMSVAPVATPFMAYAEDSIVVPASTAAKTGTINITRMDTTSTPVKGSKFKAYRIFDLVQAANSDGRATYSLRVADGYSNIPGVQDIVDAQDKLGSPGSTHFCLNRLRNSQCLYLTFLYNGRRREWQPTPVLLLGRSHGWRSLVGCSPQDR